MTSYIDEVHVTTDGGVIKKVIKAGEGDKPTKGQEVTVNYEGRLEDGSVFDRSADHGEPLKIRIGEGQVIEGWDQGIMDMQLGEKADLVIQSKYGYGEMGSPPKIPGGATLIFTVELIQINDRRPTRWQMSDPELLAVALRQKDDGNLKFKDKKFKEAEGLYRDALGHITTCKLANAEINKLTVVLYQNLSTSLNYSGDHAEAVAQCTLAMKIDDKSWKAHYQRGIAHQKLKNYDEATTDYKNAIKLNPQDKKLRAEFETLKAQKKAYGQSQAGAMQRAFAQGLYNEKEAPKEDRTYDALPAFDPENAQVYFDLEVGTPGEEGNEKGRVVFELFTKKVPKTAGNFLSICNGDNDLNLCYKGNFFHRVIKGFMAQGGDITNQNGTGGRSIYGEKFPDEQIWYPHTHKGVLSMANAGPDTNGSQFFICFGPTPHLNEKHTIYGRIIHNYKFIEEIEQNPAGAQDKPLKQVTIVDCSELLREDKLPADKCDFLPHYTGDDLIDSDEEQKDEEEEKKE